MATEALNKCIAIREEEWPVEFSVTYHYTFLEDFIE